jgi:hypothetical protein
MKDKTKSSQRTDASKSARPGSKKPSSPKGPTKEFETHKSPEKPGDNKPKRLGESETEIDDETTI